jgi:hypothetical protein
MVFSSIREKGRSSATVGEEIASALPGALIYFIYMFFIDLYLPSDLERAIYSAFEEFMGPLLFVFC